MGHIEKNWFRCQGKTFRCVGRQGAWHRIYVCRDVTTGNPVELWQCFAGTCYLHKVISSRRRRHFRNVAALLTDYTASQCRRRDDQTTTLTNTNLPNFLKSYWTSFEGRTVQPSFSQNTLRSKHGCQKEELQVKFPYIKNCLDVCLILSYCSVIRFAEHLNI